MRERYLRNIPALTEEECALLREKRVLIVGCGGLGGHLVELLTRVGVGSIRVVDGDVFEPSNLNRQLLATPALLGAGKAEAAVRRIAEISPETEAQAFSVFLDEHNGPELVQGCDVVLDALDSITTRKILAGVCAESGVPYVYGAIGGWVAQAAVSMPGDGLTDLLYPARTVVRDKSILSFTPALCASMQAALCVKLLTGRPVEPGTVHYFDLLNMEFETIPMI